ncbi:hypothetical protein IWX87_000791 [Polaromonas sp. CG_9.7]|nr:hypothetical protein [Polaromonas sp. CG_9.7]MBG6113044.1 hypothetical protein [Polaromonas sp. CG_9.2]MDH6185576.1 hypothetical protein [Polaromonas sp. CG_23.6]
MVLQSILLHLASGNFEEANRAAGLAALSSCAVRDAPRLTDRK